MRLAGTITLYYPEDRYDACIDSAVVTDDSVRFDFHGPVGQTCQFRGSCELLRQSDGSYAGHGLFAARDGKTHASVRANCLHHSDGLDLDGEWQDHGDPEAYILSIELRRISP